MACGHVSQVNFGPLKGPVSIGHEGMARISPSDAGLLDRAMQLAQRPYQSLRKTVEATVT